MPSLLRAIPALAWAVLIFVLSSQSRLPVPSAFIFEGADKMAHATVYAVLAVLALFALGWPRNWRAHFVVLLCLGYGMSDEWHQSFVPGRTPDILDLLADAAGALLAVGLVLAYARRHDARLRGSAARDR